MSSQNDRLTMEEKLFEAAMRGDSATIRVLAMSGVDVDARNAEGFTAFSLATSKGHHNTALTILAARQMKYFGTATLHPQYEEAREMNPLRTASVGRT